MNDLVADSAGPPTGSPNNGRRRDAQQGPVLKQTVSQRKVLNSVVLSLGDASQCAIAEFARIRAISHRARTLSEFGYIKLKTTEAQILPLILADRPLRGFGRPPEKIRDLSDQRRCRFHAQRYGWAKSIATWQRSPALRKSRASGPDMLPWQA